MYSELNRVKGRQLAVVIRVTFFLFILLREKNVALHGDQRNKHPNCVLSHKSGQLVSKIKKKI